MRRDTSWFCEIVKLAATNDAAKGKRCYRLPMGKMRSYTLRQHYPGLRIICLQLPEHG